MVDDRPEDTGPSPDSGRAQARRRRPSIWKPPRSPARPPHADAGAGADADRLNRSRAPAPQPRPGVRSGVARCRRGHWPAPVAAALVIGVGWMLGWPRSRPTRRPRRRPTPPRSTGSPRGSPASSRRPASLPPPRPIRRRRRASRRWRNRCLAARRTRRRARAIGQARRRRQRGEVGAARCRRAAGSVCDQRAAVAQIERTTRAQSAEIAQENAKPADDAAASPRRGGVAARCVGAAGRSLCRGAGGGEIADARTPDALEAARWLCRLRRAERSQLSAANC